MRRAFAPLALVASALAGVALADDVTVQRNIVDVLQGKASYYPVLASAKKGETLHVEDTEGRWLKVNYNGVEGYVLAASINGPDVAETAAGVSTAAAGANSDVAASAAAKGWDPIAWSKDKGYSTAGLEAMIATKKRLEANPRKIDQFKRDGHVGVD